MAENFYPMDYESLLQEKSNKKKEEMVMKYINERRQYFRPKEEKVECEICFDEIDSDFMYTVPGCEHRFCIPCMQEYFQNQVKNRGILKCPEQNCEVELQVTDLIEKGVIYDKQLLDRYYEMSLKNYLDDKGAIYCPKCSTPMIGEEGITMVRCVKAECGYCFCNKCQCDWHADCTCEQYQRWKRENAIGDKGAQEWARRNAKQCPSCHQYIEKNQGCNHMTCRCGYQFCWLCLQRYTPNHFSNGRCRQYS